VTTPDGTVWRYLYDPLGRRIAKQYLDADGGIAEQTEFTWDGPTVAEQATAPGPAEGHTLAGKVTTWDYQPGTFSPVIQAERAMVNEAAQHDIDQRFYAIVTDLIGAPSELTAPDGGLAGYQQRTLWGATLWHPGGASTPLRFPGQYADPETGLHYNHHRYYDPATGCYLSPDPLGLIPAPNPHTYVPNPTSYADPLGLEGCRIATVESGKWDYIFGKVDSSDHNFARSVQNANQLARIGIYDNPEGRVLLQENFNQAVATDDNIVQSFTNKYGSFQVRDSLLSGPGGFLRLETTWEVTNGGYRLTTVIPFGGP